MITRHLDRVTWDRSREFPSLAKEPKDLFKTPGQALCLWARGFIANRKELLARLGLPEQLSNSELLTRLYEHYGLRVPTHLTGPWAWVLWDARNRWIIAARDRLGIHGLYYTLKGKLFELSGDASSLQAPTSLNPRAVVAQINGEAPPHGETFFTETRALEPGSLLVVTQEKMTLERYWCLEPQPVRRRPTDMAYAEELRNLLLQVTSEYREDRSVGVTLSGGLDSTAVAASLRRGSQDAPSAAFSWVSPELPEADESLSIAATAERLGCPLVTIPADQHWPLQKESGLPVSPASPFLNPYYDLWEITFQTVRNRDVAVLFSGLSGDHLFGGNVCSYPDLLLTGRWLRLALEIKAHLPSSELGLPRLLRHRVLGPIARTGLPHLRRWRVEPLPWLSLDVRSELMEEAPRAGRHLLPGRKERLGVLQDPLLPVIAEAATRQAARHGIDFRHPLLDHRLFELAASLPTTQTFAAGVQKVILRNAMRGLLPDEVVDRRHKVYPTAIAERGLRERERAKVWALMTNMVAAEMGFVIEARLREEYQRYLDGKTGSALFWHTLTLEAWLREYFT